MKVVSWNIRGMSSDVKKRILRNLARERRPDILMIKESKLDKTDLFQAQKRKMLISSIQWKKQRVHLVA